MICFVYLYCSLDALHQPEEKGQADDQGNGEPEVKPLHWLSAIGPPPKVSRLVFLQVVETGAMEYCNATIMTQGD